MPFADWLRARRERREEHLHAAEEARLLKLYWNRVELKRSLDDLEEEVRQLRDLLKQQQALLHRAGEDAEGLEQVLANPELGFGAMVHFALRGLWRAGRVQLQQVATEMRRQHEEQERRAQQTGLQSARRLRLQEAENRCGSGAGYRCTRPSGGSGTRSHLALRPLVLLPTSGTARGRGRRTHP
jgi:hypothetical protein